MQYNYCYFQNQILTHSQSIIHSSPWALDNYYFNLEIPYFYGTWRFITMFMKASH